MRTSEPRTWEIKDARALIGCSWQLWDGRAGGYRGCRSVSGRGNTAVAAAPCVPGRGQPAWSDRRFPRRVGAVDPHPGRARLATVMFAVPSWLNRSKRPQTQACDRAEKAELRVVIGEIRPAYGICSPRQLGARSPRPTGSACPGASRSRLGGSQEQDRRRSTAMRPVRTS